MKRQSNIEKLVSSIIGSFVPESASMKEVVGLAVDEKSVVPDDFSCNICMTLVYDPYACNKCD